MTRIILALLLLTVPALAHDSWISRGALRNGIGEWCCGEGDCAVMDDGAVTVTARGYHFNGIGRINAGAPGEIAQRYDEIVPFSEVSPIAPDGKYWRCKRPDNSRRCAFGPPQGS